MLHPFNQSKPKPKPNNLMEIPEKAEIAKFKEIFAAYKKLTPEERYRRCQATWIGQGESLPKLKYVPPGGAGEGSVEKERGGADAYECSKKQKERGGAAYECSKQQKERGGAAYECSQDVEDMNDIEYPDDTPKHHHPHLDLILTKYETQVALSKGFDILDYPGFPALIRPLSNFTPQFELLMELANRAIMIYNDRDCNVFKYKVLKIEKVNYMFTTYHQYFMTVKVLNLTLGTPIETFQIHVGERIWHDRKIVYSCWSKEEAAVAGERYSMLVRRKREVCDGSKGGDTWPVEV